MPEVVHLPGFNGIQFINLIFKEPALIIFVFIFFQNIRIDAVNILSSITKYPAFVILPFAPDVLFGLQAALDDHKRLVRNAAVLARNQWFLVGVEQ